MTIRLGGGEYDANIVTLVKRRVLKARRESLKFRRRRDFLGLAHNRRRIEASAQAESDRHVASQSKPYGIIEAATKLFDGLLVAHFVFRFDSQFPIPANDERQGPSHLERQTMTAGQLTDSFEKRVVGIIHKSEFKESEHRTGIRHPSDL